MQLSNWVGALRERNFSLYFLGQTTSQLGSGMAPVAVTFAVLAHGTASDVGYVAAAGLTPVVVFILVGGVLADAASRRVVMVSADALRAFAETALGLWVLLARPPLWGFMLAAALVGLGQAFFDPASTGLVPQVVSGARLQQANALNGLSNSIGGVVGPALAGVIVALWSPGYAVLIDGLTYVVSVVSLYLIRVEWRPVETSESFQARLRLGWREFWARTWLWVIVVEFSMVNVVCFASMFVLGPVVAKQSLGGAAAWGLIVAFEGAGAIVGGLVMLRFRPTRPLLVATLCPIAFAWPLIALGARSPSAVIAAGNFFAGVGIAVFSTLWATTMQREVPSEILSRVSAYDWFGSLVFLPVGMALVGPVASVVGVAPTFYGSAVVLLVLVFLTLAVPSVVQMRAPSDSGAKAG